MAHYTDWLPTRREQQLAMAKTWCDVIGQKLSVWNLSSSVPMSFQSLVNAAEEALVKAESPERTAVITAQCRDAFDKMTAQMRDIKDRYFKSPPLEDPDFIALGLKLRDTIKTPVAAPQGQAEADVSYPGPHLLQLHLKPLSGTHIDERADHGYRIYWGVLPPGGANVKAATGAERYLMAAPTQGEDLPHSRFTRKQKETFEFPATDSASTVYFAIRFENSKGESGPWGEVFSAVVP